MQDKRIDDLKRQLKGIRDLKDKLKRLQREKHNLEKLRENYKDRFVTFIEVRNDRENPGKEKK